VDFNGFWMNFHYIFFDNDLFLLDPNVSIMINMFPSNFFFAVVFGIIVLFISMIVLLKILLVLLKHRIERRLV
jgi:TIGR01906 family protein